MGRLAGLLALVALVVGLGWFVVCSSVEDAGAAVAPVTAPIAPQKAPAPMLTASATAGPGSPETPGGAGLGAEPSEPVAPTAHRAGPEGEAVSRAKELPPALESNPSFTPEQQRASLSAQVIGLSSGKPLADARAILGITAPPTTARKPAFSSELRTDGEGRVVFRGVRPGAYRFTIIRGSVVEHRDLDLGVAEDLDLGRVLFDNGPAVLIRVVDEHGRPAPSLVQVGTLERVNQHRQNSIPAKHVDEVYGRSAWEATDLGGTVLVPMPTARAPVRARPLHAEGTDQDDRGVWTLNGWISFQNRTLEVVLVTRQPVSVVFEGTSLGPTEHLDIVEQTDSLVLHRLRTLSGTTEFMPGPYAIELWREGQFVDVLARLGIDSQTKLISLP